MVDRDVVARRLLALQEALAQLAGSGGGDVELLRREPMRRAAVERWLQLAIEACIDMAYHVCAASEWTPPDNARGAFRLLADHGLIAAELAEGLGDASGMRNILVHEYAAVDLAAIAGAVRGDLDQLRAFGARMAELLAEPDPND